jgi:hypothetical protein
MKKLLLMIAAMTAISFYSVAQSAATGADRGGIGIRAGGNFFNFGGNDAPSNDYNNRIGFNAGLYSSIYLGESLAIEPGVFYAVKGTQNNDLANSRAILSYVDIPVVFRVFAGENFNIMFGPQLSVLTGSRFEGDLFGSTFTFNTDSITPTDFGLLFGLAYTLPKGLNIQGAYNYGMSKVFRNSNAEIYNRGFTVSLGYTF